MTRDTTGRGNMPEHNASPSHDEPTMSTRTKIVAAVVVAVLALAGVAGFFRLAAPKIRPGQLPPASHYGATCEWCHVRSADAPKIEVK